jgi:hypothetical protein
MLVAAATRHEPLDPGFAPGIGRRRRRGFFDDAHLLRFVRSGGGETFVEIL